jgi:hypothetical protein
MMVEKSSDQEARADQIQHSPITTANAVTRMAMPYEIHSVIAEYEYTFWKVLNVTLTGGGAKGEEESGLHECQYNGKGKAECSVVSLTGVNQRSSY